MSGAVAPIPELLSRMPIDYPYLKAAIAGQPLPLALLDLDTLENNALNMLHRAGTLPIRLGTKSIRCVDVLRRVQRLSPRFQGLLCFSAREAVWLADLGFDDLLVAYPTVDLADIDAVAGAIARGAKITLMVDDPEQVVALAARARAHRVRLRLAIDLDCSTAEPGLYFGVRRSPIQTPDAALGLATAITMHPDAVKLVGLMGYEAQIAGLPDALPHQRVKSLLVRWLKSRSMKTVIARRQATVQVLRAAGHVLEFVNGGGTGSLKETAADTSVTEIAAGSGLYSPCLFDHFRGFHHQPSLLFALQVVRRPAPGLVIASGPAGADRLPQPWLPADMRLLPLEGAGEVQTPVRLPPEFVPKLGDPLFFRHAKAGELAERFDRFVLMQRGLIIGDTPTYRGHGKTFF